MTKIPCTVLMAQINPTVGAIKANAEKIMHIIAENQEKHDLIIFPELALSGYPPEDLLFRKEFQQQLAEYLNKITTSVGNCHVILGHPSLENDRVFNSASVLYQGHSLAKYHKQKLPNYGVFDECRYFIPGTADPCIIEIKQQKIGLCICEDLWQEGPMQDLIKHGATTIIVINASPFASEKYQLREDLVQPYSQQGVNIIYVNQTGGQDELVFDGQSFAMDASNTVRARAPAFEESLISLSLQGMTITGPITPLLSKEALIYKALVCGTHDYVKKNNFPGVLVGLSGGIDSALTLTIAVDALGAEHVHAVMMPSRYSAAISEEDALEQVQKLKVAYSILSIEPAFQAFLATLQPEFAGLATDSTEENIQARSRAVLLMALSNKKGSLVLTTSNKSETAVGYTTLYGDMAGGFAVLKDVLKTQVYALAKYRNAIAPVIPERVIHRAPSAELKENQTDQDTLPDYKVLDAIIDGYMLDTLSPEELKNELVQKTIRLIKRNEYKRRQAAPGIKISLISFDKDWRYPITNG
ncbi:MAG: NAD+ synthase [Legionella sp.]